MCVCKGRARTRLPTADRHRHPPTARESATSTQTITSNSAVPTMGRVMHPEYATCMQTSTLLRGERASICWRARGRGQKECRAACATQCRCRPTQRTRPARAHSAVHLRDSGVTDSLLDISMCAKLRGRLPDCTPRCGVARAATSTARHSQSRNDVAATHPFYAERGQMTRMRTIYRIYCVCRPLRRFLTRRKWLLSDSITPAHFPK
jgi:hypothetical protein